MTAHAAHDLLTPVPRDRPVGRYAPSPTGTLHLGNLRTALLAWMQIRALGGTFILRIEDIDGPRTVPGSEAAILEDLRWLGLDWDEGPDVGGPAGPYRQSQRDALYAAALARLDSAGSTYLCTCSRRELRNASGADDEASAPHGPDGPPYPGFCRERDPAAQRRHPNGAAVRLRVPAAPIRFGDLRLGPQSFDLPTLSGDFVIRRRDGLWAYQLACALDDALMGVTHVLRGEDLLTSTPRQIAILRALGLPEPQYEHVPLVLDAGGRRMSKRDGSESLASLRRVGMTPAQARELILSSTTDGTTTSA